MVELIGGIEVDGELRRDVALKPLTGEAELLLAELGDAPLSYPEKVTRFLEATLQSVGGQPAEPGSLSVGDRQHLVRKIGVRMGIDLVWLGGECASCGESFEIPVRQDEMPFKSAGAGYPESAVEITGRMVPIRTPKGMDQAAIVDLSPDDAARCLLERLTSQSDFSVDERADVERAIEDLSPEVALEVLAECPDCAAELRVEVDPYLTLARAGQEIVDDIHVLASRYHWAEADILALPRERRHAYLSRIDRDRGMMPQPDPGLAV